MKVFFSGVKKGDRVTIYMPMIIETVTAMLACSRIGATHNVVVSLILRETLNLLFRNFFYLDSLQTAL